MKRSEIKRKPAKRRARGTGCQFGRRCLAIGEYTNPRTQQVYRVCAKHWADALFADLIRDSLHGRCWADGQPGAGTTCNGGIQCAHIMSRRYMSLRWDASNARPLCQAHHHWFTHRPADWEQFCRDRYVDWDDLRHRALSDPPMQPMFVIERLKEIA